MDIDGPSRDDELLAELAALDQVLRTPAESARPPLPPTDLGLTEPPELALASRNRAALVAAAAAAAIPLPRRSLVRRPLIVALSCGLLAGGILGWWLTRSSSVDGSLDESEVDEPSFTALDDLRTAPPATLPPPTAPVASRAAAPKRAPPAAAALPPAASAVLSEAAATTSITPPGVASPLAASPREAAAIVTAIPRAPAPSFDVPLPAAPLPIAPLVAPAAPPAVAAAGAIAAVAADERAIETTLRRYEEAYERLDAKAASVVWPTVDQRALSRAFAGLASQNLDFSGCEVIVRAGASTATASCSGTAEYVRKVGDARVRIEPRQWTFTLNKTQGAWTIEAVDGSR